MEKLEAKQNFFCHYAAILRMVQFNTQRYDLDYDDTLNFVLEKLCKNDYKAIRSFRGESKFTTFLTVIVNHSIYRFAGKKKHLIEPPENSIQSPLDSIFKQQNLRYQEIFNENLKSMLNDLDYKEKLVLKMKYYKNMKISQIAKLLGLNRYKTQKILNTAVENLKNKSKEMFMDQNLIIDP